MKYLSILGSTGSIGTQTLNIARRFSDRFKVVALAANSNVQLLAKQAREFNVKFVGITDEKAYLTNKDLFKGIEVSTGENALVDAASYQGVDTVVAAVVGMCGLKSVAKAAKLKRNIALANKESLVAGGEIVMQLVKQNSVNLTPIDSEHSAIWQCLMGGKQGLKRIILTASGGAFFGKDYKQLSKITPIEATTHPNWSMGKKITVDSSTMMNKGLEIIEARWLFDTLDIDYIIHPESIIHSMVEFVDGSCLAQMSKPNMEHAIQLSLSYPDRLPTNLEFFKFDKPLTFFEPDENNFPLPKIAKQALKIGGTAPCVLNSANEAAVKLFLDGSIGFLDIQKIIADTLQKQDFIFNPTLDDIIQTHAQVYNKIVADYSA